MAVVTSVIPGSKWQDKKGLDQGYPKELPPPAQFTLEARVCASMTGQFALAHHRHPGAGRKLQAGGDHHQ